MQYIALATDYDGTIAHDGRVTPETIAALERLRASARRSILVTGRELPDLRAAFPRLDLFDLIVAENGALLFDPASGEETLLGPAPDETFVARLRAAGVAPLSVGRVIVATWEPNEQAVLEAVRAEGLELQIIFNKGAVMVLPPGVNKASGLAAALDKRGISPRNCVGVGDAENDLAFLDLCGFPVAVANALDSVKTRAALVTEADHGAGVEALIDRMLDHDLRDEEATAGRGRVALGQDEADETLFWRPARERLLITGRSGSGKSTLALGLLERLGAAGLQWLVIDPEGDYEGLDDALTEGTADAPPEPPRVAQSLRMGRKGVVATMLAVPLADRPLFLAHLLPEIAALRVQTGRPHVLLIDEAHHMLPRDGDVSGGAAPDPGVIFLTTHPDQLLSHVVAGIDRLLVVGQGASEAMAAFCTARGIDTPVAPAELTQGEFLLFEPEAGSVRVLRAIPGAADKRRHKRKYAEGKLGEDASFYFRGPEGKLNLRAHNLMMFLQLADGVDADTWEFHRRQGEYSAWIRERVKDADLAGEVAAIEAGDDDADTSRRHVREAVEKVYTAPG